MSFHKNFSKVDYHEGIVKTECDCTECRKKFLARLDYDIDGNHKIICPYCGHIHWRVITKGVVTSERWGRGGFVDTKTECFWHDDVLQMDTTTVAAHIRERFLK
jgi:DNA-directed RNA polymerase subunit RPC12/RpoP